MYIQIVELIYDGIAIPENLNLYFKREVENLPYNWAIINIFNNGIRINSINIYIEKEETNAVYMSNINNKKLNKLVIDRVSYYAFRKGVEYIVSKEQLPKFTKSGTELYYKEINQENRVYKHMISIYSSVEEFNSKAKINFINLCSDFRDIIDKSEKLQNFEETISRLF